MSAPLPEPVRLFAAALGERYQVQREIGAGGMATVYLAEDLKHRRLVAIKVLRPELAQALGAERFLREIEIAAQLHHPHILPLFDSGEAAGLLYYVMPFVEGESLRQKLAREGALPIAEATRLLGEIAGALGKAHHAGIVHRDIKPENILLSDGHALVSDFGVARAVSAAGSTGMTTLGLAVGTPAYMSPEQAAADPRLDHRADIYALGLLAYEMLSGRTTFVGETPQEVLAAQVTREPEPLDHLRADTPAALSALVMQCLRKSPGERPQTMEEVLPVLAEGASGSTFVGAAARRRNASWIRIAVAAAVVLALAAGGAALAGRFGSAPAQQSQVPARSLAVLPFATLHGDSTDAYFGEGIAEEILHAVSRIPGLHVTGRTSSFRYGDRDMDLRLIGRELGVARVLEGSVQRIGQRIRVTAQLVDAATGYGLWSERYDRNVEDIFAVQDEIARSVADALEVQLAGGADTSSGTRDLGAHDAYLLALSHLHRRDVLAAIEQFRRAIAADSGYADAMRGWPARGRWLRNTRRFRPTARWRRQRRKRGGLWRSTAANGAPSPRSATFKRITSGSTRRLSAPTAPRLHSTRTMRQCATGMASCSTCSGGSRRRGCSIVRRWRWTRRRRRRTYRSAGIFWRPGWDSPAATRRQPTSGVPQS